MVRFQPCSLAAIRPADPTNKGTAGLVVAARLTENPDVTVGVLEAGKNRLGDMVRCLCALTAQSGRH